ncbi:hypothetical protein LNP05_15060 [Klebsiella pneumoniae subsp. pneumoniae]|nr:hypothetical protein [Klebsiella pneumoniae subsp. pneumoniae]
MLRVRSSRLRETVKKAIEAQKWLKEFAGEQGEKAKWRREKLNLPPIPEPEIDAVTGEILSAYAMISRGRKYAGMAGVPLPLSLNDIELYLASRTILIERIEFDAAILALDDAWRAEWAEEQKRRAIVK